MAQAPSLKPGEKEVRRAQAQAAKERGNTYFKAGKWLEARDEFTAAIELDGSDAIFWSNRSGANAKLAKLGAAREDAVRATELAPAWWKAWARRAQADLALEDWKSAEQSSARALELGPPDDRVEELQQGLQRARRANNLPQLSTQELKEAYHGELRKMSLASLRREAERAKISCEGMGDDREKLLGALTAEPERKPKAEPKAAGCCCCRRQPPAPAERGPVSTRGQEALERRRKKVQKVEKLSEKQLLKRLRKHKIDTSQCTGHADLVALLVHVEGESVDENQVARRAQFLGLFCLFLVTCAVFGAILSSLVGKDEEEPEQAQGPIGQGQVRRLRGLFAAATRLRG